MSLKSDIVSNSTTRCGIEVRHDDDDDGAAALTSIFRAPRSLPLRSYFPSIIGRFILKFEGIRSSVRRSVCMVARRHRPLRRRGPSSLPCFLPCLPRGSLLSFCKERAAPSIHIDDDFVSDFSGFTATPALCAALQ